MPPLHLAALLIIAMETGIILALVDNFLEAIYSCGELLHLPFLTYGNALIPETKTPECLNTLFDSFWLYHLKEAIIHDNQLAAGGTFRTLIYPNVEVVEMFLAKIMKDYNLQKTVNQIRTQAEADAVTREARVQSWYETNKDRIGPDVPPPPINGHQNEPTTRS